MWYVGMCMAQHICKGQKTTLSSQCSPSTTWVLEMELELGGLAAIFHNQ